jgi:hypothetical protein
LELLHHVAAAREAVLHDEYHARGAVPDGLQPVVRVPRQTAPNSGDL